MKSQVYDRFGGGLIVLILLTIAVIAGQAEPSFDEPILTEDEFELDAGLQITIGQKRLTEFEALSSVVETTFDLPIRIEVSIEESESSAPDIAASSDDFATSSDDSADSSDSPAL